MDPPEEGGSQYKNRPTRSHQDGWQEHAGNGDEQTLTFNNN